MYLFEDYHQSSSGPYCKYESTHLRMADLSGHAKVWVYCRSNPGIAGSNPSGIWLSSSCECCVLSGRRLCDGSITHRRGVLRSVVCLSVMQEPHRGGVDPPWLSSHDRKKKTLVYVSLKTITSHRLDVLDYKPFWHKQE